MENDPYCYKGLDERDSHYPLKILVKLNYEKFWAFVLKYKPTYIYDIN